MKRLLSLLLCLMTLISVAAPAAYAMDVPASNGFGMDDVYFADGSNVVYNDDGSFTLTSSDTSTLLPSELGSDEEKTSDTAQGENVPEELGQASATVEDTTVDAFGVPKDSSLVIQEAKPEMDAAIEQVTAENDRTGAELFRYDISVQDKNGLDWQPNGKVRLELDAGQKLHKNQEVYVVHVSDDGVAERIDAKVNDAGKIEFETTGFSTFAGFTVDFEYEDAQFSIKGLESILLSEVFEKLSMPLDVEDVKDVTFTDYSLISVEQQGKDWLLTSLEAFQTTEALTVTMDDGAVYEIKVTDDVSNPASFYMALYGGNYYTNVDTSGNGVVQLFLDSDGYPSSNDTGVSYAGDFVKQPLVIDGEGDGGCMEIVLQKAEGAGDTLVWDLVELKIIGGAKVVIRLGDSFKGTETITIKSVQPYTYAARPLFNIEDGSLYFNLSSENASLCSGTGMTVASESSVIFSK